MKTVNRRKPAGGPVAPATICLCELIRNGGVLAEGRLSLWYFEPAWFYSCPEIVRGLDAAEMDIRSDGSPHLCKSAVVNGWVTSLLARTLTGNDLVSFSREPVTGKPFASQDRSFRFNISHSNHCTLFGAVRGMEVGVDIEEISAVPDAVSSAGCFLSVAESAMLKASSPGYGKAILRLWTLKESFSKVSGKGVYENFLGLDFSHMLSNGAEFGSFRGATLYSPVINPDVVVSVAVEGSCKSAEIRVLRPASCCFEAKRG